MRDGAITDQLVAPESVEEVLALSRYGAKMEVEAKPRLVQNELEPGRKHPSCKLCATFSVKSGGKTAEFEKTYAKGHEIAPPTAAANGFIIANTRMNRDVKKLKKAGVKCVAAPFVLSELLAGTDLAEFEPTKPYHLDQFGILAGIGVPVQVSMTTCTSSVEENGADLHELRAIYSVYCRGEQYRIEIAHGRFTKKDDQSKVARVHEVALHRLSLEQRKLRRVGVEIDTDLSWRPEQDHRRLHVAPGEVAGGVHPERDQASLYAAQGE